MFKMMFKMGKGLEKWGDDKSRQLKKSMSTALKVEAFRLKKTGAMLIKKGELGLKQKTLLEYKHTAKGKRRKQSGKKSRVPFKSFARGFLYKFDSKTMFAQVGFVGTTAGTNWQAKIIKKSVPGYRWLYKASKIAKLHKIGIHLKKHTTSADVPERGVIDAILEHEGKAKILKNISTNFHRKMAGERI
jgi:hypothetical protein